MLTLLNPWSWTPMWLTWLAITVIVRSRPNVRNALLAGGVELQESRAVLESLSPLGPAARGVTAVDGEDR